MDYRLERDSLGEMRVPAAAWYGPQTARAVENFPVSGQGLPTPLVRALGLVKWACARAHQEAEPEHERLWSCVATAAREVVAGKYDDQFVVDVYQTGSGTSSNMNANEVIARRATELLSGSRDGSPRVHPNDHVNKGQSSNDVFPTAIHVAFAQLLSQSLLPAAVALVAELEAKAVEFAGIYKIGRTHLMDATPVTLGQEFRGYATQVAQAAARVRESIAGLHELALGGTAVGTGLNADPARVARAIALLAEETGLPFTEAGDHFAAQGGKDAVVHAHGSLRTLAVALSKVANDIRWLGSGPRCGLGELTLPATQPGSSIMPGKVNPVQAEALLMACARVFGNDTTVTCAGAGGIFELNVMMPVLADAVLQSATVLAGAMRAFTDKCVRGLVADTARCAELVDRSLAMVTSLVPVLGYDRAAELAKQAAAEGTTIRELLEASGEVDAATLAHLLDPRFMTGGEG